MTKDVAENGIDRATNTLTNHQRDLIVTEIHVDVDVRCGIEHRITGVASIDGIQDGISAVVG